MSTVQGSPSTPPRPAPIVRAFPEPGKGIQQAYRELDLADTGTDAQRKALGDLNLLPRPWDPASLTQPQLRLEVWAWLEAVTTWLNLEYVWDVSAMIPPCWPQHPHLVHEIAVIADQRRRAGRALTSDALEEWHRYALPSFIDRMKGRSRNHCEEGHQDWPAKGRFARHVSDEQANERRRAFNADQQTQRASRASQQPQGPQLRVVDDDLAVDTDTGEIFD